MNQKISYKKRRDGDRNWKWKLQYKGRDDYSRDMVLLSGSVLMQTSGITDAISKYPIIWDHAL